MSDHMLFCPKCERPLRVVKNGVIIERQSIEAMPYQVFHGDVWGCPMCGNEVLKTAKEPWTESHKPDYAEEAAKAEHVVYG